jgi:CDP-diacylglycerol pyrophosphatase
MLAVSVATSADAAGSRDVLWEIMTSCLDPGVADYCGICRSPRVETACAAGLSCKETTEVWAETDAFVVLRDRKMCGCPDDFVHGLAIPRARVTGVEDPLRPDGIWAFAWSTALKKIGDESAAALAVNPKGTRAQDQLHVHILRLKKDARQRFGKARVTRVQQLEQVWCAAGREAAAARLDDYGILVAKHPEGGFVVVVDSVSPEKSYAVERCQ